MKLLSLKLKDFKGVKSFELNPDGANCSVWGDNGTGKTTLADALSWLFSGKDTAGQELKPKTLDLQGTELHNLTHEAEAVFALDGGGTLELKKAFKEIWTKPRGKATQVFGGHTTDHFVNGVPVSEAEYTEQVKRICTPEQARLLTDPDYFAGKMDWKKRRALLLDVCGDVSDADVIASTPALAELPAILGTHTMDEHKRIVDSTRKQINARQKELPARIDEVRRTLPVVVMERATDEAHAAGLRAKIDSLNTALGGLTTGGQDVALRRELVQAEGEVAKAKQAVDEAARRARHQAEDDIRAARQKAEEPVEACRKTLRILKSELQETEQARAAAERGKRTLEPELQRLRDAYDSTHASDFTGATTCPTCQQDLPAHMLQEARGNFNEQKAEALARLKAQGLQMKADLDALGLRIAECLQRETALDEDIRLAEVALHEAEAALAEPTQAPAPIAPGYSVDPAVQQAEAKVADLRTRIAGLQQDTGTEVERQRINREMDATKTDLRATEGRIAASIEADKAHARIEELEKEQRTLGAEWERLERELALIDLFTRTKVGLLTARINSRFGLAQFRLFKEQVNGGLEECCDVTYQGVPYGGGLNTGSRINVGLDIIRTLSQHFGCSLPVFADNAESVTRLLDIPSQVIRLVVSPTDPSLRVELDSAQANLFERNAA